MGARFVVSLPIRAVEIANASDAAARAPRSPRGALVGKRVLVVDDDRDAVELVTLVLSEEGAIVDAATSAAGALAKLDVAPPDLLVSDIGMPVMDGYALIVAIRARSAERGGATPAIALTAYAHAEERDKALRAGFQTYLPKPVDPDELVRAVEALASAPR
jgi:CheY-like chemotaxis protein